MKHWQVSFTRRGMEPPRPFGKTKQVVCAATREDAREQVSGAAAESYPIRASATNEKVSFGRSCSCPVTP